MKNVEIALLFTLCAPAPVVGGTRLDALPSAAREAILRVAWPHRAFEIEKEAVGDSWGWEAEYSVDGMEHCVLVSEGGEVLEVTKEMDPAKLPSPVQAAVKERHPGGVIREAEAVHLRGEEEASFYELEVVSRGRRKELRLKPSGEMLPDDEP